MNSLQFSRADRILNKLVYIVIVIFILGWILGIRGPVFIANEKCYALLGCNIGFFGYDAVLHFVSGIMNATLLVWLMRRFPKINLFHGRFWKNFLIIVALVALISFCWEFGELGHDQFRMKILHYNLTVPNHLDQPTNADTMGDMTFALVGAALTAVALKPLLKKE